MQSETLSLAPWRRFLKHLVVGQGSVDTGAKRPQRTAPLRLGSRTASSEQRTTPTGRAPARRPPQWQKRAAATRNARDRLGAGLPSRRSSRLAAQREATSLRRHHIDPTLTLRVIGTGKPLKALHLVLRLGGDAYATLGVLGPRSPGYDFRPGLSAIEVRRSRSPSCRPSAAPGRFSCRGDPDQKTDAREASAMRGARQRARGGRSRHAPPAGGHRRAAGHRLTRTT